MAAHDILEEDRRGLAHLQRHLLRVRVRPNLNPNPNPNPSPSPNLQRHWLLGKQGNPNPTPNPTPSPSPNLQRHWLLGKQAEHGDEALRLPLRTREARLGCHDRGPAES